MQMSSWCLEDENIPNFTVVHQFSAFLFSNT